MSMLNPQNDVHHTPCTRHKDTIVLHERVLPALDFQYVLISNLFNYFEQSIKPLLEPHSRPGYCTFSANKKHKFLINIFMEQYFSN